MANSKISLITGVIIPVIVVITTIAMFFVWTNEERSALFYLNLSYTVLLELLFFGYIRFMRMGVTHFTGAFYSIMAVWSIYYIIVGFLVMLLSWALPIKFYITLLVIITLFWLIVGALVAQTDSDHKEDMELTEQKNKKLMNK